MENYKTVKILPPISETDYYEIEVRDDDDEFVEFDTADSMDEALAVAKKFLEKYKN